MPALREVDRLTVEEITTSADLYQLGPAWSDLWERAPAATPFQAPAWLLTWWRHFGGAQLWTLAVRREGRLVALAPMFVHHDPNRGIRQATLVGNGLSDHLDFVIDPAFAGDSVPALLTRLADRHGSWDCGDFRDLPASSPLLPGPRAGLTARIEQEQPCPVLSLPESEARLHEHVPRPLLKQLRYCRRRAAREGGLECELVTADRAGDGFAELLRLQRARWGRRAGPGVLDGPGVADFHRDVSTRFAERGWLRLYVLRIGGEVAAVYYGFTARRRSYYYLGGFDPAYEKLSPGSLIILHAIEEAVREGVHEVDFLRGAESYKYAWGARDRPQFRLRLRPAGFARHPG